MPHQIQNLSISSKMKPILNVQYSSSQFESSFIIILTIYAEYSRWWNETMFLQVPPGTISSFLSNPSVSRCMCTGEMREVAQLKMTFLIYFQLLFHLGHDLIIFLMPHSNLGREVAARLKLLEWNGHGVGAEEQDEGHESQVRNILAGFAH